MVSSDTPEAFASSICDNPAAPRKSFNVGISAAEYAARSLRSQRPIGVLLALEEEVVRALPVPAAVVELDPPTAPVHGLALRAKQVRHSRDQQEDDPDRYQNREWVDEDADEPDDDANKGKLARRLKAGKCGAHGRFSLLMF
jgi:hypothetical protein